ncbi:MAG: O-antigen ligase family protein [Patescibacteria group bacterium]
MPAKTYLKILQIGLLASLLIVFFVFKDLLFPYITSKQLSFNILMEILGAIWLVFILRYPAYRPKKNLITFGLAAYFGAVLISCAVSVDFNLSFWGDSERMLGFFHLFHFLIFYLILITVFRSWREWRALFFVSVAVATLVSLFGLTGPEVFSSIGNTAYVSGYLIFNLFFCLILFFRASGKGWRWLYLLPVAIMLLEFKAAFTSGAIVGLFCGILLLFFLLGLFHKNKGLRRISLVTFGAVVILLIVLFSQSKTPWFQNSFLKSFTFQKITFQTRLISWKGAAADFKYHPLFGTGFGNYAIIFDKHFDSKFFNYMKSETYFDRAHNNLIDIVSTTGLVGLLAYLSIFAAVLYYLIMEFRKNGARVGGREDGNRRNLEILIIIALVAAYFIQNLVVFDSFVTYIGLMIILGFIYWRISERAEMTGETDREDNGEKRLVISGSWELTILIISLIIAYVFIYQCSIRPWRMFQGVIVGYGDIVQGNLSAGIAAYRKALIGTPLDRDGRATLISLVSGSNLLSSLPADTAGDIADYVISLAEKNVAENPQDSLMQMQLAQILDMTARLNFDNLIKFNYYSARAVNAINRSIEASPGRAPVYLVKAQMLLIRGEKDEAIKTVEYAISLNTEYSEGYCRLAQFYLLLKDDEKIGAPLDKCADLGGTDDLNSGPLLLKAIAYYVDKGDYTRALKFSERLTVVYDSDPEAWFNLAKLYLITGDATRTQVAVSKALALDPKREKDWQDFLASLEKLPAGN